MDRYYLLQDIVSGKQMLFESDGTFYDHDDQDLFIATFEDEKYAQVVCDMLNNTINE